MTKSELIRFLEPYKRTMFGDPKYGEVSVAEIIDALEEQNSGVNRNIWTCPNCGGTFTFQSCPHCNAEMEVEHE